MRNFIPLFPTAIIPLGCLLPLDVHQQWSFPTTCTIDVARSELRHRTSIVPVG